MIRKISPKALLFIFPLWLLTSLGFAAPWKYEIDPYIWAINMNGHVGVGPATAHVDQSFSEILRHLNMAAMVYASAHNGRYGIYGNAVYAVTSVDASEDSIDIDLKNKYGIFDAGLSYIAYQNRARDHREFTVEPYAGVRYTFNNTTVNISHIAFNKNVHWSDPVVGVSLKYNFNQQWYVKASGDAGGTSRSTDFTYSALGLLGYHPATWQHTSMYLGYRLLSQTYQTGSGLNFYKWDMKLFGPLLGFSFTF